MKTRDHFRLNKLPEKTSLERRKVTGVGRFLSALLITGLVASTAQAGKIISVPSATDAAGFGGWNLDNVEVVLNGASSFNESDGSYYFGPDSDFTYQGNVNDDKLGGGTIMGYVLAKDWPVGEPSGIKIVNDDLAVKAPKPQNCIMATSYLEDHFLDSTDPQQVLCSGPFQSHKRYKLAMLPTMVDGDVDSADLVFNVEAEEGSRDYQVFQKINNWTGVRLEGFKVQVGTGVGLDFKAASDGTDGVGVENLSLSVPAAIWTYDQLANFSAGLFGPPDLQHDRPAGYYDPDTRAGFEIEEYPNLSELTDTLTSGKTLGSDYAEVPAGATDQFGPWLPDSMLPYGIFWDDDGNPETDAELLAWYGWNPNLASPALGWMTGAAGGFAAVTSQTIVGWGNNLEYTMGEIDDLVNVGLNYIVTIGDVVNFPNGQFTIRITPVVDTSGAGVPDYVGKTPDPVLEFGSSNGVVTISPEPEFVVGELLTLRVGDADLTESVDVQVTDGVVGPDCSTDASTTTVNLIEQGEGRGVFAATTDAFIGVPADTVVTVMYDDDNTGDGSTELKCASTTAIEELTPPPPVADVWITDFSAPATLFVNQTRKLSLTITNAKEAEASASGTVTVTGVYADGTTSDVTFPEDTFEGLAPNKKLRFSYNWTAEAEGVVNWTATVNVDGTDVPVTATASTAVTVKPGNSNNNGNK